MLERLRALVGVWALVVVALGFGLGMGGCIGEAKAPVFDVVGGRVASVSDQGVVVRFEVLGGNGNDADLPLREVSYWVEVGGERVFDGRRVARATLPRLGEQMVELPAALRYEDALRVGLVGVVEGGVEARVGGTVVYELPGSIAELYFDSGLRRPKAGFVGTVRVEGVE